MTKVIDETGLEEYCSKVKEKIPFISTSADTTPLKLSPKQISAHVEEVTIPWSSNGSSVTGTLTARKIMLTSDICIVCGSATIDPQIPYIMAHESRSVYLNFDGIFESIYSGTAKASIPSQRKSETQHLRVYYNKPRLEVYSGQGYISNTSGTHSVSLSFIAIGKAA